MAELRLTPAALRDLEDIWAYTAEQWSTAQADRYLDGLNSAFEAIVRMPTLAARCDHIRAGYRRHVVERHAIYLRVADHAVIVVRVLHERMDASRHL